MSEPVLGSVFVKTVDIALWVQVLGKALLWSDERTTATVASADGGWLELPGDVDVFVQQCSPEQASCGAGWVVDSVDAVKQSVESAFPDLRVSETFDVAPSVQGVNVYLAETDSDHIFFHTGPAFND